MKNFALYLMRLSLSGPLGPPKCQAKNGAGEETRTLDSHLGKVALYQLSYTRSINYLG